MTTLDRTVDRLIAEENRAFLADPAAIAEAQADGERYRLAIEAEHEAEMRAEQGMEDAFGGWTD